MKILFSLLLFISFSVYSYQCGEFVQEHRGLRDIRTLPITDLQSYRLEASDRIVVIPCPDLTNLVFDNGFEAPDSSLAYQDFLASYNYSPPEIDEGMANAFRGALTNLFRSNAQMSQAQLEAVARRNQNAANYDAITRDVPLSQQSISNLQDEIQDRNSKIEDLVAKNRAYAEQIKQIQSSNYSVFKKKALTNLILVKMDFKKYEGEVGKQINIVRSKFQAISEKSLKGEKSYPFLDMGANAYHHATSEYKNGNKGAASESIEFANTFLDIALGSTPFVSVFKDAYEVYTGENLITGEKLTDIDRNIAIIGFGAGILTGGVVSSNKIKFVSRIFPSMENAKNLIQNTYEAVRKTAPIKTPFGEATQEMSKDAIVARVKTQNGGYMYRLGKKGRSQTGKDAQFWSLEHPKTNGYAQRYGIPEENVQNADFIERATIKNGHNFITRKAPPLGNNRGGGIEIVTSKNGVVIESHTTLD